MSVLLAIGRFFKKIWDWIKQTAWIQPLLIVGIIFGIIFSIRPIVNAAKNTRAKRGEYNTFYTNYRLSLDGAADGESEADIFTYKLNDLFNGEIDAQTFKDTCGKDVGDKFFVAYVAKECTACDDIRDGFATFKDNLNAGAAGFEASTEDKFNMVTIFGDDDKYEDSEPEDIPFYHYCLNHAEFFENVAGFAEGTDYYNNGKIEDSKLESLVKADCTEFYTPTIILVELNNSESIITEVMFGVEGSDKYSQASTLFDCWEHKGNFSADRKD